jgi:hypothetical protein
MRFLTVIAALALAGLAGCGGGDEEGGTIPPENAESMLSQLDGVRSAIDEENCTTAKTDTSQFVEAVNGLPEETGVETKEKLRQAGENLDELIAEECEDTGVTGETGPTETTETTTEEPAAPVTPPPAPSDEGEDAPPEQPPGEGGNPPGGGGPGGDTGEDTGGIGEGKDKEKKPKPDKQHGHGGGKGPG